MKAVLITLIAFIGMAFSCENTKEEVLPPGSGELVGSWQLIEPGSAYKITLTIERDAQSGNYRLLGQSSVNQYFATVANPALSVSSTANLFSIQNLGSTKMAGPVEAMQFEQTYFTNLRAVKRYELTNQNKLRLFYEGDSSGVLIYDRTK